MKKFIVIYHAPITVVMEMVKAAPANQAKGMQAWMMWAKKCGSQLVDMGAPLANGIQLGVDGKTKLSDKNVVGYSIVMAKSMEDAKSLIAGHPHLLMHPGCSIEIHESMPIPGM